MKRLLLPLLSRRRRLVAHVKKRNVSRCTVSASHLARSVLRSVPAMVAITIINIMIRFVKLERSSNISWPAHRNKTMGKVAIVRKVNVKKSTVNALMQG